MLHVMTLLCALSAPTRVDSWAQGLEAAAAADQPIIVFAHGSDWCLHGERLKASIWDSGSDVDGVVFVDVDVRESSDEANDTRNKGFKIKSIKTFPSLIAYAPDGTRLGVRGGATLGNETKAARQVLHGLVAEAKARMALLGEAQAAADRGDTAAEIAAWHAMLTQELDRPDGAIERLEEIDPEDRDGVRRRAAFGGFHQLVFKASKDGKDGRGAEAVERFQAMLDEGVYTPAQEAWIHCALGSAYRYWEGHDEQAHTHFKSAAAVAPDSVGGIAGRRLGLQLYGGPSLELGWQPRHLTTEETTWSIDDLPKPLKRGRYTVTFKWTRGRHGLDVSSVRLLDGAMTPVEDVHEGFAGTAPRDNVYELHLLWDYDAPVLEVIARGSGGTNGHGEILLTRVGD